jgi:phytanoyl-CoA hydroxylase
MTVDILTPTHPHTIDGVNLHVNDGLLTSNEVDKLHPSYPSEPMEVLRERYNKNGYLLLKGLLPREDVLSARASYFESLSASGVIEPGSAAVDGIFNSSASASDYPGIGAGSLGGNSRPGETDKSEVFVDLALKAHTDDWYCGSEDGKTKGFCNHPVLRDFISRFSGWGDDTLAVKRTLLRNNTPGNKAIGVHYDQSFMRYGEPTSVTAWVPIGDVSLDGGGLIYLEGGMFSSVLLSNRVMTNTSLGEKLGEEIENDFNAKAKAAGMSDEEMRNAFNANMMSTGFLCEGPGDFGRRYGRKWLVTAYEAGDVVLHTPHMVSWTSRR